MTITLTFREPTERDSSDVYAWSIRRTLPEIPIPLSPPDPDLCLDLASVVARAYDQGRYERASSATRPRSSFPWPLKIGNGWRSSVLHR